jgi:transposase
VQSITRMAARQTRVRDAKLRIFPNSAYFRVCGYPHTRKNWLFTWTELGARQVGIVQSLLVTCRLHDINPYDYFVDVLQRVGQHPASQVHELSPRIWKQRFAQNPLRSDLHQPAT